MLDNLFRIVQSVLFKESKIYLIVFLVLLLFVSVLISNYNKAGLGDFYYHATVVNELNQNLFKPMHPSYGTLDTTQHFTPYHVIVSIFCRITGLQALDAMHVMAVFNVLLFLLMFYVFTRSVYGYFSVLSLVFVLFLWGAAWNFSGEYSYRMIGIVASYHSMFSIWMMLFVFYLARKVHKYSVFTLPIFSFLAIMSQPISIFTVLIGVCILLWDGDRTIKQWAFHSVIYIISVVSLMLLWPYYPVLSLELSGSNQVLSSWPNTFCMYDPIKVFRVLWPLVLVIPFIFLGRIKENRILILISLGVLIPYLSLSWTNSELVGRNLPYIVFFLLVSSGYSFEYLLRKKQRWMIAFVILLPIIMYNMVKGFSIYTERSTSHVMELKDEIKVVSPLVEHHDVVIADMKTGYYLAAYSGKIVATIFKQKFVKDDKQRRTDISTFFKNSTSNNVRKKMIDKYAARYVLVNKDTVVLPGIQSGVISLSVQDSLQALGETVLDLKHVRLIRLKETFYQNSVEHGI